MSTETQLVALQQQLPPPKYSRYRSVRRANGLDATSPPTLPLRVAAARRDGSVTRSPSRYHRKAKSADTTTKTAADQRVARAAPLHSHSASLAALTGESNPTFTAQDARNNHVKAISNNNPVTSSPDRIKSFPKPAHGSNDGPIATSEQIPQAPQSGIGTDPTVSRLATSADELNEESHEKLGAEEERMLRIKSKQHTAREFERSKRMVSPDKRRAGSLQNRERDMAEASVSTSQGRDPTLATKRDDGIPNPALEDVDNVAQNMGGRAVKNATKAHDLAPEQRCAPATAEAQPVSAQSLSPHRKLARPNETKLNPSANLLNMPAHSHPSIPSSSTRENLQSGPVASDIPRSAVNAGERRVVVKYDGSVISLPITPTTTSQDVLTSAATQLSSRFDPQQSVLLESFTQLGLERPLRKYEHVRDIMNSWDYDTQNQLVVVTTSANGLSKGDGDPRALPKQPGGTSLYMYHSQRPGKWDKRWVSLKEDGQISISKREDGSESSNLCHLSDFDIYTPTPRQMKKLRPPKKACFAIKSQQKSVMFLNGANFVHFFAASEGPLTETWYSAVRTWRSWYLVHVLGEGKEQGNRDITSARNHAKAQTVAPRMGEKDPLVSPKRVQQPTSELPVKGSPTKSVPKAPSSVALQSRHVREVSLRGRSAPPSSFPSSLIHQPDPRVPLSTSKRSSSRPRGSERAASIRSDVEAPSSPKRSTALSRAGSIRQAPKPLVDLTPQFQEQPHHLKKGRGVAPIPGKPLVELATDVEALPGAISIPPARAWQRPQNSGLRDTAGTLAHVKPARGVAAPLSENEAFTGAGLLGRSRSRRTQGGIGHGYGVKTGDRNHVGEPLVDLRMESQFTDGSLLRQVEAFKGEDDQGLILDRSKRTEKEVRMGEGV